MQSSPPRQQTKRQQALSRKEFRRVMNAIARANAPGKDERIAAAAVKRDRKNAKRLRDWKTTI